MHTLSKPLTKIWLALVLSAAFLAPANAQSAFGGNWYFGGGLSALDLDVAEEGGFSDTVVNLVGGVPLGEYLDAEMRLGLGLSGDEIPGTSAELGIDTLVAIGLRVGLPIGDVFRPYMVLGFSSVEVGLTEGSLTISGTDEDIFYGIGAGWRFGQGYEITAEFSNYLDKDDIEISGFSMRFTTSF